MACRRRSGAKEIRASGKARRTQIGQLAGAGAEGGDVVDRAGRAIAAGASSSASRAVTASGMAMNGMRVSSRTKQAYGRRLRGSVDHLRRVVARAAARLREGGDQPGEADRPEVDPARLARGQLPVVTREVAPEVLAVELVAAVHRGRRKPGGSRPPCRPRAWRRGPAARRPRSSSGRGTGPDGRASGPRRRPDARGSACPAR